MSAITNEGRDALGLKVEMRTHTSGGSGTYTEVTLLKSIDDGGATTGKVDYTHSQSPSRTKQYKAGWNDPQEYSFEHHWTLASYAAVKTAQASGALQDIKVTLPAGPNGEEGFTDTFTGFVTKADKKGDGTSDDTVGFTWAVQVTGVITSAGVEPA